MVGGGGWEGEVVGARVLLGVEDVEVVSARDRMRGWWVERLD